MGHRLDGTAARLAERAPRPAEGDGPFPAVLVIHGGGWKGGNKADSRPFLVELARRGYVAISPQYRFSPKDTFPSQVLDVKAAVRWLKAHASEYKVDPDRVKFWEVMGTLRWGIMCCGMMQRFRAGPDHSMERAMIGRRSSETEIDLLRLLAPRGA